jgi:hypothetical protein
MEGAPADRPTRRGHVARLRVAAAGQLGGPQRRTPLGKGSLDRGPDLIGHRADPGPIVGRQAADPAQDQTEQALLAQEISLESLERGAVLGGGQRVERVDAEAV